MSEDGAEHRVDSKVANSAEWPVEILGSRDARRVMSGGSITGSGAMAGALCDAMEARDGRVLGVMDGGTQGLIGYVWLARLPFDAEIQALGVIPDYRGRGVGNALISAACTLAKRWQSERLLLEVRAGNVAAIALYRRHGFSEDGRRKNYYPAAPDSHDASREDALLLSCALTT